jgi:hypothetical protein
MDALAPGVLGSQLLQLRDQLDVSGRSEVGVDACFQRREPLLFQPSDLRRRERLERQVRECRTPPQRQALTHQDGGALRVTRVERPPTFLDAAREPLGVELTRPHPQPITRRRGDNGVRVCERLAQPRDVHLHRLHRAGRHFLAPQGRRQPLCADGLVGVQQQHRQHRARLDTCHRHRP